MHLRQAEMHEPNRLLIDEPLDLIIKTQVTAVNGWVLSNKRDALRDSALMEFDRGETHKVRVCFYDRSDLNADCSGFTAFLDVRSFTALGKFKLVMSDGDTRFEALFECSRLLLEAGRSASLSPLKAHERSLAKKTAVTKCLKPQYRSDFFPINTLPKTWPLDHKIENKSDGVSAFPYGATVQRFLDDLQPNACVIDIGAGLRTSPRDDVITVEIYDYPTTDVLAIGSELPFEDNSVDGILSLAVLEHVPDPFECAREIYRILKPGGRALVMIPFLQAEHGYPSHYFNATREGVKQLFKEFNLVDQFLEISNHPILTLNQVIQIYCSALPEEFRQSFLNLSITELVQIAVSHANQTGEYLNWLELNDEAWKICWGTTSIFQK